MLFIRYLILVTSFLSALAVKAEEIVDIVNTHNYTLYNKATTITREFNIAPQPGFANLTIVSATPLSDSQFVMCSMRVYQPGGGLVQSISCQGPGDDTRVISPSVDASTGLRLELALQYFDSEQPSNLAKSYSFRSRFRFSDTVDTGEVVEPEEPVEPPVEESSIQQVSDYKSGMAKAKGTTSQSMIFPKNPDYPVLIGFNRIISMINISNCTFQVIGYKKVEGKTVGTLYHNGNCAANSAMLLPTALYPTDYDSISVITRFQNPKTFATFVSSNVELLLGSNLDNDADGMPAWFEEYYEFSDQDANDALVDTDSDGYTNLEEYLAGSDPTDAASIPAM